MKLNRNSIHYRFYNFIRGLHSYLFEDENRKSENLVQKSYYFYNHSWMKWISEKFGIHDFSFKLYTDIRPLMPVFLKKTALYQLWGGGIIVAVTALLNSAGVFEGIFGKETAFSKIVPGLMNGILPIFLGLFIAGLFTDMGKKIQSLFRFRAHESFNPPRFFLIYMLQLILFPLYLIIVAVMFNVGEIFMNFIVSILMYLITGVILFCQAFALTFNLIALVVVYTAKGVWMGIISSIWVLGRFFSFLGKLFSPVLKLLAAKAE